MTTLLDEIAAVFERQIDINDLPATDPTVVLGRECEALFTNGVDTLRTLIPNDRIRALARVVWDLVGHKQALVVLGARVPSLSFTVLRQADGIMQGIVMIPPGWPEMVRTDTFMQLGAILYVGVQIVDFYNDRLIHDPTAVARWAAYEAELLHTLRKISVWDANEYQRAIMKKYPKGLDTTGVELYAFKSYEPPKGAA